MRLLNGLYVHEIVLLALGSCLFLLLLVLLSSRGKTKGSISSLIPFFVMSVLMIAYPSIEKITYGSLIVDTRRMSEALENAQGQEAKKLSDKLRSRLAEIEQRPIRDENVAFEIAKAQLSVSQDDKALRFAKVALNLNPHFEKAQVFVKKLESVR